ncbi:hypothetical protein K491DRAFT_696173 [Lophiostoma macrostomum CBS 122681]|uniref:N-acetyltransferase domain-containing protein n=1 Tax=Lophiostoma macrostomum CBS 122681 TaxID=1314788 RepID=A0A6A6SXS4_9PLEO|nr:hypothetical protein K491DRAFT_696173 [Lophiostoma macrostomum CBS 122681]
MPLEVSEAWPDDAARIPELYLTAFGPNAMLRAQSPSPDVRIALQSLLEKTTLAETENSNTTVLVARHHRLWFLRKRFL